MSIMQRTAFHANMKSCPVRYERQHKSFTHIEHHTGVAGRLHSSLLRICFRGFTVRIPVHTAKKCGRNLSDAWRSTFKIGPAQLRSGTRIVPKSPFLFVKRSSTRYNVRVDARAIRHSVNKPCCSWINSVIQVLSNIALQLNLVNRFKGAVSRQSSSFCLILQITRLQSLWNLK